MTHKDSITGKYIRQVRYRIRHLQLGLCEECPKPVAPSSKRKCILHLERHRADEAKRRAKT